jgi:hypothetical protein
MCGLIHARVPVRVPIQAPEAELTTNDCDLRAELPYHGRRTTLTAGSGCHAAQSGAIFLAIEALFESAQGAAAGDFGRLVELELELTHLTGLRLTRPSAFRTLANGKTGGKADAPLDGC